MSVESPYETPKSSLIDVLHDDICRNGRYVVIRPDVEWPSRCFKCNEDTILKKEVKLTYINPWIYLSILINVLITIILALIFRKKFTVDLPLCERHVKRRKNFLIFQWTMVAVITAGIIIGSLTELTFFLGISMLVLLMVLVSAIFGRLAFAAKYKNEYIWVTGAGKEFLKSLPEFVA
ncbi:MAG: hypothetical protein GKR93_01685 [Gammaproteobacteria bacterium]|nr:hypothetical protein [Gammaproteobacteria bacterium]